MNLANRLTCARIALAFICVWFTLKNTFPSLLAAFFVFILASFTDFLDGMLARKKNLISDLGKLLDPIADKVLIIGVFVSFLELGLINTWMVVVIMLREFIITGLRLLALNRGVVLEARKFGKHKTFSQITGIIIIYVSLILTRKYPLISIADFLYVYVIPFVMWYVLVITLFSGVYYLWANRKTIRTF